MDSVEGATQIRMDEVEKYNSIGRKNMKTIVIGGKEYQVEDAVAAEFDARQGKIDQAMDEIKGFKEAQTKEDKVDVAKIVEDGVSTIISTYEDAKDFLPDNFSLKGKTQRDIKIEAIKSTSPTFNAKDKSDDYINARFDMLLESAEVTAEGEREDDESDSKDTEKARQDEIAKMKEARKNMFKGGK
jgi:hypothetical protein